MWESQRPVAGLQQETISPVSAVFGASHFGGRLLSTLAVVPSLSISRPDARRAALRHLIDYAGLFPPASLDMESAVAEYRAARTGSDAWIVDRFICPVSRLEELLGVLAPTMTVGEESWRLAVTAGWLGDLSAHAGSMRAFEDTAGSAATVDLVEVRVPPGTAADTGALDEAARDILRAYRAVVAFEIPWDDAVDTAFDALAAVRADVGRALLVKIRCGGLTAESFPPSEAVARFLLQAEERSLPVKATAGLHHPFRHTDPETGFTHHGFVNLLAAAALTAAGAHIGTVTGALSETDPDVFEIAPAGISWRDHRAGRDALDAVRSKLFVGYGSCSFTDPVEDLTGLGVLPL